MRPWISIAGLVSRPVLGSVVVPAVVLNDYNDFKHPPTLDNDRRRVEVWKYGGLLRIYSSLTYYIFQFLNFGYPRRSQTITKLWIFVGSETLMAHEATVLASYLEIYNEKIYDLLAGASAKSLHAHELNAFVGSARQRCWWTTSVQIQAETAQTFLRMQPDEIGTYQQTSLFCNIWAFQGEIIQIWVQ